MRNLMTTNYHFHGNIATSANIVLHSLIECAEGTYLLYDLNAQQNKRNMVSGWRVAMILDTYLYLQPT